MIVVQITLGRIDPGRKGGTDSTDKDGLGTNLYWDQDSAEGRFFIMKMRVKITAMGVNMMDGDGRIVYHV